MVSETKWSQYLQECILSDMAVGNWMVQRLNSMMINADCHLDRLYNHLGDKLPGMPMPMRDYLD